jgi:predicted NBD/HSP70 family sugar kinase
VDIFTRILTHGPIGRVDIGRQTGLSQSAVTKTVTPLIDDGFVTVDESAAGRATSPGRPVHPLTAVPDAMLSIGVKVGLDEVIGVATTMTTEILHSVRVPMRRHTVHAVVTAALHAVTSLRATLGPDDERVAGVGVSVSGDVDTRTGTVRDSPLLGWKQVPLGAILAEKLGHAVLIDNDVRALTIAEEWFGVGVDADSFAIVTIGSGIGCGLYLNGDVVSGAWGVAGEIGHLPLGPANALCLCGRHGCVEAVASSGAILAAVRNARSDPALTMTDAVELAHAGNRAAVAAFDRAGTAIGAALAAMVNLTGPEIVLVAGEAVTDYDLYERRIREQFLEHAFGAAAQCRIVTRTHTFNDWARGAAASVIRATVRQELPRLDAAPRTRTVG